MICPRLTVVIGMFLLLCAPSVSSAAQDAATAKPDAQPAGEAQADGLAWPRVLDAHGSTITIYQPHVEKWSGNQVEARAAVSIQNAAAPHPTYGVAWFSARTEVDRLNRTVQLHDFEVTKVNFPTGDEDYKTLIQNSLPTGTRTMSLDRLEASLRTSEAESPMAKVEVKNTVPAIYITQGPAILVLIDGKPQLRDTDQSGLLRIINTRALIVFDKPRGLYYLYVTDRWLQADTVTGPWAVATDAPTAGLDAVKKQAVQMREVDLFDKPGAEAQKMLDSGEVPKIIVSTTPAALIETEGEPNWSPIPGTNLLYAQNTTSTLILDVEQQKYYVLLAGRWFASKSLDGPWDYVAHDALPAAFAKIPPEHPKGNALVSVAGTPEAQEAAIASTVPQTATVYRDEAQAEIEYDGEPKFEPIESTELQYAVNTPTPVIMVAPQQYYACYNGVWFSASGPRGPWIVATAVPPVIYRIPPSSPIFYCTYVRVWGFTPRVVYVGYYPGYYGTYITPSGCIVYGTGYVYPAYYGTVWIGPPVTYGFGAGFRWGFATGFALGYMTGAWCHPWWGPGGYGWGYRNVNINVNVYNINVYNRWNKRAVVAHNDHGGFYGRAGNTRVAGKKGGNIYADHNGNVYRRENGQWQKRENGQWQPIQRPVRDGQLGDRISQRQQGDGRLLQQNDGQRVQQARDRLSTSDWLDRQQQSRLYGQQRYQDHQYRLQNYRNSGGSFGTDQGGRFGGRGYGGGGFGGFQSNGFGSDFDQRGAGGLRDGGGFHGGGGGRRR